MDKYTQYDVNGSIDVIASATAYAEALTAYKGANEFPTENIEAAVEAVFDRFEGHPVLVPTLIDLAVGSLLTDPGQHSALTKRVQAYIKGQKTSGRLSVKNGKGGGVVRLHKPNSPPNA